jgi:zinc protease
MSNSAIADRNLRHDVLEVTLTNGLRVLVREDHRTPVATCNIWVGVGSNREDDDIRGWSHGIEHMLFKGTTRRGEADFALEVAAMGGSTNAGTGYETTNYHITCPAEHIDQAVDILHDALFHSAFDQKALDAEREVLVHENHMYDDQPSGFGVTWKWALEMAYDQSPYQHPIGGRDEVLLETPRDDIEKFWRRAYRPDNMTVVIAGDVNSDDVLSGVVARFGAEANPDLPKLANPAPEPAHDAMRFRFEQGDVQRVYAKMILPGLSENDEDRAALAVLLQILSDGRSSRLYRTVQEERELVSGITLLSEAGPREGLLMVDLETGPEQCREALIAAAEVLAELRTTPPSRNELDRAKIRAERSFILGRESVQGQASSLGWHDLMGDLDGAFDHPARVAAVTADDVMRLACRLVRAEQMSVMVYAPRNADRSLFPADAQEAATMLAEALPSVDAPSAPAQKPKQASAAIIFKPNDTAAQAQPFEEILLSGGTRCYIRRDTTLPVISLGLYACGGVGLQPEGSHGLVSLTQQVHAKASRDFDAVSLARFIEDRGASLGTHTNRDQTGLHLTGLNRHLDELIDTLGTLAAHPAFPEDELEKERRFSLDDLQALDDDPFQFAAMALRREVYGDHPYSQALIGTPESLANITRDDMIAHHRRIWVSRNMNIVISGDVDRDAIAARLETALSDIPSGNCPSSTDLSQVPQPIGLNAQRLERDVRQSVVLTAWRGPTDPNTDRAALAMLQALLNGQSGRLFAELRNRRSLCYSSGVMITRGFAPGMVAGYVLTDPEHEIEATNALVTELNSMASDPVSMDEFNRARARLVGNMLIALQSNNARVGRCAADVLYGRPPNNLAYYLEEIRKLDPAQVRDTAARYLGSENRFEVIVGPARD